MKLGTIEIQVVIRQLCILMTPFGTVKGVVLTAAVSGPYTPLPGSQHSSTPLSITDDIEVRSCSNEGTATSNVGIELIELYIM